MFLPNQVLSESKLKTEVESLRSTHQLVVNVVALIAGILVVVFLPYLHIGVIYHYLWAEYNLHVNRSTCSCSCWDTTFKGIYETGVSTYKHVYINATANSFKMWCVTIVVSCLLTDSIRTIICLHYNKKLRLNFCILFLLNIYPIYYSWWGYLNYWNDEYYKQWYHQMLFTMTEVSSSMMSIHLTNMDETIQPWKLLIIFNIALAHTFIALMDQFASNVLRGQGERHQIFRDVGFMIPDVVHIYVPLKEFVILGRKRRMPPFFLISNKAFAMSVGFLISMLIFASTL